jgi:hypothetical protein
MPPLKTWKDVEDLVGLTPELMVAQPVPCADCGTPTDLSAMWYVPHGRHPIHCCTRAICRTCRDQRLAELAKGAA